MDLSQIIRIIADAASNNRSAFRDRIPISGTESDQESNDDDAEMDNEPANSQAPWLQAAESSLPLLVSLAPKTQGAKYER